MFLRKHFKATDYLLNCLKNFMKCCWTTLFFFLKKAILKFMFQLTDSEVNIMVSQNAIPSRQHLGGALPYVFTEHGVLQLSNVLKSERAAQVSIHIIEVFIKIRELLLTNKDILLQLEKMQQSLDEHDDRIDLIYNYLKQFIEDQKKPRTEVGYKT